jgi:outer membrane protein TolC
VPAAPADALERGPWWQLFGDPVLDSLVAGVEVSNQNVAVAVANYAAARAAVQQERAALFPSVTLTWGDRSGVRGQGADSSYRLNLGGSWEPDVWGRLRAGVTSAQAGAEASAADLASARLSSQGELASNYFTIRALDAQRALLAHDQPATSASCRSRRTASTSASPPAPTCCRPRPSSPTRAATNLSLRRQRAQFEHAIAVLVGKAPSQFALAPSPTGASRLPEVPVGVPATLLQRRPTSPPPNAMSPPPTRKSASRARPISRTSVCRARSARGGSRVGDLFSLSNAAWSFGLSAAQSIFNAGATRAASRAPKHATRRRWRATGRRC